MRGGPGEPSSPFVWAHSPPDSPSARGHFITFPRLKNAKVINGAPPVDAGDGHRHHGAQACRAHTSRTISIHAPVSPPQARLLGPIRHGHARPLVSYRTAFYRSRNGTGNRLAQPRSLLGHAKGCSPFREKRNALDVRFFGRFFVSHNIMNLIEELKFIQLFLAEPLADLTKRVFTGRRYHRRCCRQGAEPACSMMGEFD
jgi:hypothetical protein